MTAIIYPSGHVWNIQDFGDPLCGLRSDISTQSDEASFTAALQSGETIQVRSGNYVFRNWDSVGGACVVNAEASVKVRFAAGARLIAGAELNTKVGGMFRIKTVSYPSTDDTLVLDLEGGVFDATALAPVISGISLLDLYGFKRVRVANAVGYAGTGYLENGELANGGDTFICTHECENVLIDACRSIGFYDCAIYLSGGEAHEVRGGYYKYNGTIVAAKRNAKNLIIHGVYGTENNNGFMGSPADEELDDHGRQWIIANNFLFKCHGRPIEVHMGQGDIIQGNHIEDYAKKGALGTTYTGASSNNPIAGIALHGSVGANVSGNWVGYRNWDTSNPTAHQEPRGILVGPFVDNNSTTPDVQSTDNMIEHNTLVGPWVGIDESLGSDANSFYNNIEKGTAHDDLIKGPNSWVDIDRLKTTFTPVLTATTGSAATDNVVGVYQMSNKRIDFSIFYDLKADWGSTPLSGPLKITGLPFEAEDLAQVTCRVDINNGSTSHTTGYTYWLGVIVGGTKEILLMEGGNTGDGMISMTAARISGDTRFNISGTYWCKYPA